MKIRRLAVVALSAIVLASALIGGCGGVQVEVGEATTVPTIQVSLLIHVSEDDVQWFRDFEVLKGTNAYELTEQATEGELESTYYASLFSHWVESIMGVPNEAPNYWLIFQWNGSTEQWEPPARWRRPVLAEGRPRFGVGLHRHERGTPAGPGSESLKSNQGHTR